MAALKKSKHSAGFLHSNCPYIPPDGGGESARRKQLKRRWAAVYGQPIRDEQMAQIVQTVRQMIELFGRLNDECGDLG